MSQLLKLKSQDDNKEKHVTVGLEACAHKDCADSAMQLLESHGVHLCACKYNLCESGMLRDLLAEFHGVCLFFHSRSGSRLSGGGGGAQLEADQQPLVRSKATQLKPQIHQTNI